MTTIGKDTRFNGKKELISSKNSKIIIGNYCAIADGITINTLNHDSNYPAIQGYFYKKYFNSLHPGEIKNPPNKERTKGDTIIGHNVWIAKDVWIGSGVKIGDGAIIGANSVVTKDLPPYTLCCGVPCIPKKKIFRDEVIDFLLELKWWFWSDDKIKKNKRFFFSDLNKLSLSQIKNLIV